MKLSYAKYGIIFQVVFSYFLQPINKRKYYKISLYGKNMQK